MSQIVQPPGFCDISMGQGREWATHLSFTIFWLRGGEGELSTDEKTKIFSYFLMSEIDHISTMFGENFEKWKSKMAKIDYISTMVGENFEKSV